MKGAGSVEWRIGDLGSAARLGTVRCATQHTPAQYCALQSFASISGAGTRYAPGSALSEALTGCATLRLTRSSIQFVRSIRSTP